MAPLGIGQTYWHATVTTPSQAHQDDTLDDIRARYAGWHEPIPALLAATRPETLLRHAIHYLKAPLPGASCCSATPRTP